MYGGGKERIYNKDNKGRFKRVEGVVNDKKWLYQKYVIERVATRDFYKLYGISPVLLYSRLKEFNITRKHIPWNKGLLGENNPRYKKNKTTPIKKLLRRHTLYVQWKQDIFDRDDYTCMICKIRGGVLHTDHYPKTFLQVMTKNNITTMQEAIDCKELWDTNNGRTLCVNCHRNTPTWGNPMKGGG